MVKRLLSFSLKEPLCPLSCPESESADKSCLIETFNGIALYDEAEKRAIFHFPTAKKCVILKTSSNSLGHIKRFDFYRASLDGIEKLSDYFKIEEGPVGYVNKYFRNPLRKFGEDEASAFLKRQENAIISPHKNDNYGIFDNYSEAIAYVEYLQMMEEDRLSKLKHQLNKHRSINSGMITASKMSSLFKGSNEWFNDVANDTSLNTLANPEELSTVMYENYVDDEIENGLEDEESSSDVDDDITTDWESHTLEFVLEVLTKIQDRLDKLENKSG